MIVKSFIKEDAGFFGQDIASWTRNWNGVENLLEVSENADKDYISTFFKKYFSRPPKKILEGGCGTGKYVIAYRKLGYDIVGVDFSGETIRRIKEEVNEDLPVYEGDVTALPFDNGYFDCYYSGGVIEHFEKGPDIPLKEAHRVLKKGGIFLVTVPYINLLRRFCFSILSTKKGNGFLQKKYKKCQCDLHTPEGFKFCEYFFDVNSLTPHFKANGFLVQKTYPINFLWGEIGLLIHNHITRSQVCKNKVRVKSKNKIIDNPQTSIDKRSFIKNLIYCFLITENGSNVFSRLPLTLLNYLSGHLILFVTRAI